MSVDDLVACQCPYCGEWIELALDASAGAQDYVEDCQVCCRPMRVVVDVDAAGDAQARVFRDDE